MSETAARRDLQKLQRAIVDGLEDVKAHDIRVFNTEHLSPLFERVIVATGNSNRQTRALAASVLDKVREAGFAKPRLEGEDNGEWIIVDCAAAVVHVMQPAIRQYYNLEEIWGDKPVRLRTAAPLAGRSSAAARPARSPRAAPAPAKKAASKAGGNRAPANPPAAARKGVRTTGSNKTTAASRARPSSPVAGKAAASRKSVARRAR